MVRVCFLYAGWRPHLQGWWGQHGGGVPYVMFFVTLMCTLFPNPRYLLRIAIIVTLVTCGLEFLQLWQPPWLTEFRSTKFGAALLGTTFVWSDIPPYFIGGLAGYVLTAVFWRLSEGRKT